MNNSLPQYVCALHRSSVERLSEQRQTVSTTNRIGNEDALEDKFVQFLSCFIYNSE